MTFSRTHSDAEWTVGGAGGYVTLASDWSSLDLKAFRGIDGDLGGVYAPSGQVVIGGSGITVTGPTKIAYGGRLATANGARFVLGSGSHPLLGTSHVGRTRSLLTSCLEREAAPKFYWVTDLDYGGIRSIACSVIKRIASGGLSYLSSVAEYPLFALPLRVHDGATLSSAVLTFRATKPLSAPIMPKIRLVRVDAGGGTVPLMSKSAGADADGWVSLPTATSANGWYANGVAQTFAYACDQNNVVDVSQYVYYAQIFEAGGVAPGFDPAAVTFDGTLVRERKPDVVKAFTGNQATNGSATGAANGDRVLLTANTLGQENGIWIVNTGGDWTRDYDSLVFPTFFTPGALVLDAATQDVWELVSPTGQQASGVGATAANPGSTKIVFQKRTAKGNVYHSVTCAFAAIQDMRPQ